MSSGALPAPKRRHRLIACERCDGEGIIPVNPGWPDPQTEDWARCPECGGGGVVARPESGSGDASSVFTV
jgi:DnaJ-class molecular chaperone